MINKKKYINIYLMIIFNIKINIIILPKLYKQNVYYKYTIV